MCSCSRQHCFSLSHSLPLFGRLLYAMHRRSPALWGGWSSYITVGAAIVCWKTSMQASLLHKPVRIILSHRGAFTTQCPCYCASLFLSRSWERKPNKRVVQCSSESVNFAITVNPIKTDLHGLNPPPTRPSRTSQPQARSGVLFDSAEDGGCHDDAASSRLLLHRESERQWHPEMGSGSCELWLITWMPGELYRTLKSLQESV